MESISTAERAAAIRDLCLAGQAVPDDLLLPLAAAAAGNGPEAAGASGALFTGVVESLADRFDPSLCDAYADLFARVLAQCYPDYDAADLAARYRRVRAIRRYTGEGAAPDRVYVLSRVTLGADVAVTSIVLDAVKKRFPRAEICLVSGPKSRELFAADSRISHLETAYLRRGTLRQRVEAGRALAETLSHPGALVVDPDSRLTQLGLLPVCVEDNYYFFESRAFGGGGADSLSQLTKRWVAEILGVVDALPYIAPAAEVGEAPPAITVSFGVGENPGKRMGDAFESRMLKELLATGLPVMVDRGAGGEEAGRVQRAIESSGAKPGQIATWDGSFAGFAAHIAASRLYVGYDSAGQHVAAATKTPLVSVFTGAPSDRFFARWRPVGSGPVEVVRCHREDVDCALRGAIAAAGKLLTKD